MAATILDWQLCDADGPNYSALIKRAEISEISLTPSPACAHTLVTSRFPAFDPTFYDLAKQGVGKMIQIVEAIQQIAARPAHVEPAPRPRAAPMPPPRAPRAEVQRLPYRRGEFGRLVSMLPTGGD